MLKFGDSYTFRLGDTVCPDKFIGNILNQGGNTRIDWASTWSLLNERSLPLTAGARCERETRQRQIQWLVPYDTADFQKARDICRSPYIYPHIYSYSTTSFTAKDIKLENTRAH